MKPRPFRSPLFALVLLAGALVACGTTPAQQVQIGDTGCALVGVVSHDQSVATVCEDLVPVVQPVVDQIAAGIDPKKPGSVRFVQLTHNGKPAGYARAEFAADVQKAIDGTAK